MSDDNSDDDEKKPLNSDEFDEFDYLIVREFYCMACDTPLKSYQHLICHDCLNDGVNVLTQLVESLDQEEMQDKKTIFIDSNFQSTSSLEVIEEIEEVLEEEDL